MEVRGTGRTLFVCAMVLCAAQAADARSAEQHERYVKARFDANKRELKSIADAIKDARKRGVPYIGGPERDVLVEEPVLSKAQYVLQEEQRTLIYIKQRLDGKLGGDMRANLREAMLDGQRAMNQVTYGSQQEAKAQQHLAFFSRTPGRAAEAERQKAVVAAHARYVAATQRFEQTMDVYLAALGGPSIAQTLAREKELKGLREQVQQNREAREREAAATVWKEVTTAIADLGSAFGEAMAERENMTRTDTGAGWSGRQNVFDRRGLVEGEVLEKVYNGDFDPLRGDTRVRFAFESYVVKFSGMCREFLPPDSPQIATVFTEELITKVRGIEVNRTVVSERTVPTGVYAAREFANAYVRINWSDLTGIVGQLLMKGLTDPSGVFTVTTAMTRTATRFRVDLRRVISRHGCNGPVLTRLSGNLLRFAQGGPPMAR